MQPPQNPYEQQPPTQPPAPQYPQQPQQPYGNQQGYNREYRPAGGQYGAKAAGGFDIFMGVIQIIIAALAVILGGLAMIGGAVLQSGSANLGNSPQLNNLPANAGTIATIFGAALFFWGILMIIASVGIFKFRKWGMVMTAILALISTAYYGYNLIDGLRIGAAQANSGGTIFLIVFVVLSLVYTIYGFARIGSAN